jgi:hypothetical protein
MIYLILLWAVILKATRLTVYESDLYSLEEMKFLVGEYVRARKRMHEIVFYGEDNGEIYKHHRFRLESN